MTANISTHNIFKMTIKFSFVRVVRETITIMPGLFKHGTFCAQAIRSNAMATKAFCVDKNNHYPPSPLALDTFGVQKKNKECENDNESLQTMFSNPRTENCPIYGR